MCGVWFGSLLLGASQLVIALRLIMSGDVELNPGPLDQGMVIIIGVATLILAALPVSSGLANHIPQSQGLVELLRFEILSIHLQL